MALGYLFILFIILTVLSLIWSILLIYSSSPKTNVVAFCFLVFLAILIAFLGVTSLPSNHIFSSSISLAIGFLAVIAVIVRLKGNTKQMRNISNTLIITSVIAGLIKLFF
ncbi:MAG: hypothetical protein ACK5MV_02705 [Aminipila sp.]